MVPYLLMVVVVRGTLSSKIRQRVEPRWTGHFWDLLQQKCTPELSSRFWVAGRIVSYLSLHYTPTCQALF